MISRHSTCIYLVLLFVLSFLHLYFAFRTNQFFAEDDFAVLSFVKNHDLFSLLKQFLLNGDPFGFRKVLGFLNFKLLFDLFKVNPLPFILNNHTLHLANLFLLFFIVKNLTKKPFVAFFIAVIFNKFYIFSFMNIHDYLGTFFCLTSIYLFLKSDKFPRWSLFFFFLSLLTREVAASLPFLLVILTMIKKGNLKKVVPYFLLLVLYGVYQLSFIITGHLAPRNESYKISFDLLAIKSSVLFYFKPALILLLVTLPFLSRNYKAWLILVLVFITLFPTFTLINRHLLYYLYFPMTYVMIYLGLTLPDLTYKSLPVYIICILVFGGRSVFPLLAKQDYPNWQKVSLENVTMQVEETLKGNPDIDWVDLSSIYLERDAREMLRYNVVDLFIAKEFSNKYTFKSELKNKIIRVEKKF